MILQIGSVVLIAKHGDTIYTVQIDQQPIPVPGEGWLCHSKEGNWWIIQPSDDKFITSACYFTSRKHLSIYLEHFSNKIS